MRAMVLPVGRFFVNLTCNWPSSIRLSHISSWIDNLWLNWHILFSFALFVVFRDTTLSLSWGITFLPFLLPLYEPQLEMDVDVNVRVVLIDIRHGTRLSPFNWWHLFVFLGKFVPDETENKFKCIRMKLSYESCDERRDANLFILWDGVNVIDRRVHAFADNLMLMTRQTFDHLKLIFEECMTSSQSKFH